MIVGVQLLVMLDHIPTWKGILYIIGGTTITGFLIESSFGGDRMLQPHLGYVPYFWGFVITGLFFAFAYKSAR